VLNEARQWPLLLAALERQDLGLDPRFATLEERRRHSRELIAAFDAIFATRDMADWRKRLDAAGITFGLTGTLEEIPDDPQMREAGALVPYGDSTQLTISTPFGLEGSAKVKVRAAPELGQHSDAILHELGYDAADIARLRSAGAVG
jgi:crotonobetainyl-CoA:carnitine CoA-transferase CaiB-like acyl-CoA transferase